MSASVCLAMLFASSQAQEKKKPLTVLTDKVKVGPKYAVVDLAVIELSGAYDGKNFNVGGTVKNVGHADYTRTSSVLGGAYDGRQIQLFSVNPSKFGRALKLLRTISVPSLKVNQTWTTGSLAISPREYLGSGNPKFVLMLTKGDVDRDNDWKEISVSYVR